MFGERGPSGAEPTRAAGGGVRVREGGARVLGERPRAILPCAFRAGLGSWYRPASMGFEVHLRGSRRGAPREVRNPFTGALVTHAPLVMSAEEHSAALAVLARYGELDEDGGGQIALEGAALELSGFDEQGALVKVLGDLDVACRALFELATAGELLIVPDEGDAFVTTAGALARARQLATSDDTFGPFVLVATPEALAAALTASCDHARDYTAHALDA